MSDYERNIALKEGERNHCEDAYFAARPNIDKPEERKIFRDGFDRAWDILQNSRKSSDGKIITLQPIVKDELYPTVNPTMTICGND